MQGAAAASRSAIGHVLFVLKLMSTTVEDVSTHVDQLESDHDSFSTRRAVTNQPIRDRKSNNEGHGYLRSLRRTGNLKGARIDLIPQGVGPGTPLVCVSLCRGTW